MKFNRIILFLLLAVGLNTQAQVRFKKQNKEKIRALKIAYITDKLDLTEKEAEQFWPIYNKYDNKLTTLRTKERHALIKSIKNAGGELEAISDKEAKMIIEKMVAIEKEMYDTKRAFFISLQKVIPSKKIIQLQIAEMEFNRNMLRKLKKPRMKKQ